MIIYIPLEEDDKECFASFLICLSTYKPKSLKNAVPLGKEIAFWYLNCVFMASDL